MTPTPYLCFQGNCRDAMETYARLFGVPVEMMIRADEMPGYEPPEGKAEWIAHAALQFDGGLLMASDDVMGGTGPMNGCSVMLAFPTNARGAEIFAALSEGGTVRMPYQPTDWSPGFGTVTDRFGIHWMITTDEPLPGAG